MQTQHGHLKRIQKRVLEKRSAISHYNTLSIDDICKLPISDISDDDCTLFLWAIDSLLPEAFRVIEEWGFYI